MAIRSRHAVRAIRAAAEAAAQQTTGGTLILTPITLLMI